jgi:type IV pilus biogenesis protein CpaD/CtpE
MIRIAGALLLIAALGGCQEVHWPSSAATFGDSVQRNLEAQLVDPHPVWVAGAPPLDGSRAALAIGRYQTDQVKEPEELRTTDAGED